MGFVFFVAFGSKDFLFGFGLKELGNANSVVGCSFFFFFLFLRNDLVLD